MEHAALLRHIGGIMFSVRMDAGIIHGNIHNSFTPSAAPPIKNPLKLQEFFTLSTELSTISAAMDLRSKMNISLT